MQVKLKHLLNTLKCKDFLSFFCVLILKTLVCDLNQRLKHCLKVVVIVSWTLSENRFHTSIKDLNIVLSFGLQVLLAQQISIVVESIVLEGFPEGYPTGSAE